jgi:hypothetical protein
MEEERTMLQLVHIWESPSGKVLLGIVRTGQRILAQYLSGENGIQMLVIYHAHLG